MRYTLLLNSCYMNLHVLNDEKFFDSFVERLEKLNLLDNNIFIVKEQGPLKYIRRTDLVYGRLADKKNLGDISKYEKVFIHSFTFHLYRWVNQNNFKELNWMIWGKELYESSMVNYPLHEEYTKNTIQKIRNIRPKMSHYYRKAEQLLFQVDVAKVYNKIDYILTWIKPEYDYAIKHIPGLKAKHKTFAYAFELNTESLSEMYNGHSLIERKTKDGLNCIVGNSGASSNNHLDALKKMNAVNFKQITMPVSYGDKEYIDLIKKESNQNYRHINISFIEQYMNFDKYLALFKKQDVFISNSLRPIGMGNIWMALLLGKLVFMNSKNLVYPYLLSIGLKVYNIEEINKIDDILNDVDLESNRNIAADFLSKGKIDELYITLFGNGVNELNYC